MFLNNLPFAGPCEGCDGYTEIMTAAKGLYIDLDTARAGDRVYCTRCNCTGTIRTSAYGQYVDWGKDICELCEAEMDRRLAILTHQIIAQLGCLSAVITRETEG